MHTHQSFDRGNATPEIEAIQAELSRETESDTRIRFATPGDLNTINSIIRACVYEWDLPDRVKRLVLSSYHYNEQDLEHLEISVLEQGSVLVAVSALEVPNESGPVSLHGLYVSPLSRLHGFGRALVEHAMARASELGREAVIVKAQADANAYFERLGFQQQPIQDTERDYPYQWIKPIR